MGVCNFDSLKEGIFIFKQLLYAIKSTTAGKLLIY